MKAPIISVVIPAFNAAKFIGETLQSVFDQKGSDAEVIVINDGSTDQTAELLESYGKTLRVETQKNQGTSAARIAGTQMARGKFIQYLDADDLLAPGALKRKADVLETTGADAVYTDWQKLVECEPGVFEKKEMVSRRLEEIHPDPEIAFFTDFWAPPAAYLFKKTVAEKAGWSQTLPVIQDARFTVDCAHYGAVFVHSPGIGAYYRVSLETSLSRRDSRKFTRDCFQNACEVQARWAAENGLNSERKKALLKVYQYAARSSFTGDPEIFNAAYACLKQLDPDFVPDKPPALRWAARLLGYRGAERLAACYRKTKHGLRAVFGGKKPE